MQPAQRDFFELLERSQRFVLTGHEHPDGDCLGSQIGLFHLLRALGKSVRIVLPDAPLRNLEFLGQRTPFQIFDPGQGLPPCEVLVLVDCSGLDRLGAMRSAVLAAKPRIAVVDHHVDSEHGDGESCFVDVDAAASGEMVHRLYRHFAQPIDAVAAEALFVALVADTGWFKYSNSDARVFAIAADLVARGVDVAGLYDRLYRRNDPDSVAVLAEGISRSRLAAGGRVGLIRLERALVERAGRIGLDLDAVMEPLRSVADLEVVAMFKEIAADRVKVSWRASGDVDVQAIARGFGGGGHRKAAGATVSGAIDEVAARVEAAVLRALPAPLPSRGGVARP
ncbi:MAG: bifunctional oligoribonuclease/PAP phosphatase NrnA [Planctomycetes bacterium]|nr:bifunctional oligoribonuclease/PAP phosphatase NrnA [Planctomycetota bacterium]